MITLEEAVKKAKEIRAVDMCTEYEDAYLFEHSTDEMTDGGGKSPFVIKKDTGEVQSVTYYVMHAKKDDYVDLEEDAITTHKV